MRVTDTVISTLDKGLVLRLAGAEIAGVYTLAYRVASVLAIPANALAMAIFPGLVRAQVGDGDGDARRAHVQMLVVALAVGAGSAALMWGLAGALPWAMGPGFESAADMARRMAAVPALIGLSTIGCSILLASRYSILRTLTQAGGIALLVALSSWLLSPSNEVAPAIVLQATLLATSVSLWAIVLFKGPGTPRPHGRKP